MWAGVDPTGWPGHPSRWIHCRSEIPGLYFMLLELSLRVVQNSKGLFGRLFTHCLGHTCEACSSKQPSHGRLSGCTAFGLGGTSLRIFQIWRCDGAASRVHCFHFWPKRPETKEFRPQGASTWKYRQGAVATTGVASSPRIPTPRLKILSSSGGPQLSQRASKSGSC